MPSAAISTYFDASADRKIRDDLLFAVDQVDAAKVAIDCGCGAGADIAYLASRGFVVHGFDIEQDAIARCKTRFAALDNVHLSQSSFASYVFPKATLVVADASLFFCPAATFPSVWNNIYECLSPGGVFCGSFLGPEDTMAGPKYIAADYWPEVCVFEEHQVRRLFARYEVLRFTVHRSSGFTPHGEAHDWHLFSVVAKKR